MENEVYPRPRNYNEIMKDGVAKLQEYREQLNARLMDPDYSYSIDPDGIKLELALVQAQIEALLWAASVRFESAVWLHLE